MIACSGAANAKAGARRRQILEGARECVRRAGFHGASMAEIAQTAGLSVGQIYRYFENKEAIIAAIVDQDVVEVTTLLAELEAGGQPIADALIERFASEWVEHNYDPDIAALALEVLAEAARNAQVAGVVQEAGRAGGVLLRRVLDKSCPAACGEAEKAARGEVLCMMFEGMFARAISRPDTDRAAVGEVVKAVMRLLLQGAPMGAPRTETA